MPRPSRRDFLKFGSVVSGALAASRFMPRATSGTALPNIIILVFDAMSAKNLSLYGYPRQTSPNFERFAARATVYNQHYSAGNFTVPGTASLLTGLYPWTHRAINQAGLIAAEQVKHNLFQQMGERYYRLAFSQNNWPTYFFGQFKDSLERVLSPASFSLLDQYPAAAFPRDLLNSHRAFEDFILQDRQPPASLVFGLAENIALYESAMRADRQPDAADIVRTTNSPVYFRPDDVFRGIQSTLAGLKPPFLAYLHTWAPHDPYHPGREFAELFDDKWRPVSKPMHVLSRGTRRADMARKRLSYDRYIANVDFEFGRLLDGLQASGILDNSYLIVTSDHGEMFERGRVGHTTPMLYDPVVRISLLISAPGQTTRRDIHLPTSAVDLLPTLLHITGQEVPASAQGRVLPGFGGVEDPERSVFICEAKDDHPWNSWSQASYALRKDKYKLTLYTGYEQLKGQDRWELYDIDNDPEELHDLYAQSSSTAQDLRAELMQRVNAENAKYPA